jgi:hypothetical protein
MVGIGMEWEKITSGTWMGKGREGKRAAKHRDLCLCFLVLFEFSWAKNSLRCG